jgi:ATP-binding protein involved in chromosome partitioning
MALQTFHTGYPMSLTPSDESLKSAVAAALAKAVDPAKIGGLSVRGGKVAFLIEGDRSAEPLRLAAEAAACAVPGVAEVTAILSNEKPVPAQAATAGKGNGLAGVKKIIAVSSGKGGVGKSTVAVNLALALAAQGLQVGLLDADIYGPSVPRLLGLSGKPETDGQMLKPMAAFGIKAMSIGLLIDGDTAMIWRGPMATSALQQMMKDVAWGPLDVLVVDMPPGTGDIALSLAQGVPLAGAIIVSTPQDIALIDARKGLAMFRKVNVPILGLIENMSYFHCPSCDTRSDIFGHGGARDTAAKLDAPFLGEIPLHISIRETSDNGTPVVATAPSSPQAQVFMAISAQVATALHSNAKTLPTLQMID